MKRNKNFNIRKLKQKELNSNKDAKLNRSLLNRKKKKDNIAGRRLEKDSKTKKYQLNKKGEISRKKRIIFALAMFTTIFIALTVRVAWIQFVKGDGLKQMAYLQQTLDRKINPKRGTIFDTF